MRECSRSGVLSLSFNGDGVFVLRNIAFADLAMSSSLKWVKGKKFDCFSLVPFSINLSTSAYVVLSYLE